MMVKLKEMEQKIFSMMMHKIKRRRREYFIKECIQYIYVKGIEYFLKYYFSYVSVWIYFEYDYF